MKIILADDYPLFLDAMQNLLVMRGYEVVATAVNGREAVEKVEAFRPDILLMDIFMPECDGLTATRLIKENCPECKIIMLTAAEDDDNLFEAVKSGASGYLLKNLRAEELFDLLSSLEKGEAIFSPGLADKILKEFVRNSKLEQTDSSKPEVGGSSLSQRQCEVLKMAAEGKRYKEIATALGLSERTIKYHMGKILEVLHVDTKTQAISYAERKGIIHL